MTHADGQSNGERSWSTESSSERVTRSEDGQYEDEGDERLDAEDLFHWHSWTGRCVTYSARCVAQCWCEAFEDSSTDHRADSLNDDVQ